MLAHKYIFTALVVVATALTGLNSQVATAQQSTVTKPSQRYQPMASQPAPPSVHVAPDQATPLMGNANSLRHVNGVQHASAQMNLSDGSLKSGRNQYAVQQVSYQEPSVPSILAGDRSEIVPAATTNTMEKFAPAMKQIRTASSPLVVEEDMHKPVVSQMKAAVAAYQQPTPPVQQVTTPQVSASEFVNQVNSTPQVNVQEPMNASSAFRAQLTKQPSPKPTQRTTPTNYDRNVKLASSQTEAPASDAAIHLAAPSILVETFGPRSIGINKAANYKVVVTNNSGNDAERILVGINIPQWVDVQNINLSTGGKEQTDGQQQARIVWTIDRIPAGQTQTATVTAIPRKAEMFDVAVEWTLVPRSGSANIQVTQPELQMSISGPKDVLFGEKAIYHVTVRNPGTGTAENVIVMLPEALGGAREMIGNIAPGTEENFQIELLARTAGELNLVATATADGSLETSGDRQVIVRRAMLGVSIEGPPMKYAGTVGRYKITLTNTGDASANEVVTAIALPTGVTYVNGIDSVQKIDGGIRWPIGSLAPNQTKIYEINCQLDSSGDLQIEAGARGKGDLAASGACVTAVETVADLVLTVDDPKGPLPTGEKIPYQIKILNRGSRSAKGVNLVMQFSEGIEPGDATGLAHRIVPGQVLFSPISQIDPGQEMTFQVSAAAYKRGTHIFRALLTCEESDAREIAEGTTKFFGDDMDAPAHIQKTQQIDVPVQNQEQEAKTADSTGGLNDFQR